MRHQPLVLMAALLSSIKTFDWSEPHLDVNVVSVVGCGDISHDTPSNARTQVLFHPPPIDREKSGGDWSIRGDLEGQGGSPPPDKWGPCSPYKRFASPRPQCWRIMGMSFAFVRVSHVCHVHPVTTNSPTALLGVNRKDSTAGPCFCAWVAVTTVIKERT